MFLRPPAVDGVTEHRQQTTNDIIAHFQETTCLPIYALQMVVMFVCFIVYNESIAVTEKCVVVYRTAWA
jgi:hypothetical protein